MPTKSDANRQQDVMRDLFRMIGDSEKTVCAAYVQAERAGFAPRKKGEGSPTGPEFARALWVKGKAEGWLG